MPMPTPPPAPRRVVLVDVAHDDSYLVSELLRRPEISVQLVAVPPENGEGTGVKDLSDVPLTRDLGDLTDEIFDLALMGASTTRRAQIEQIFAVKGTPVLSLEGFLAGEVVRDWMDAFRPAKTSTPIEFERSDTPHAGRAADGGNGPRASAQAREPASVGDFGAPPSTDSAGRKGGAAAPLGEMPPPDDPAAIEKALLRWVHLFGATTAELHGGDAESIEWVCRSGVEDPLLKCMISLALEHDAPQVMSMLDGYQRGSIRAAWPFRTGFRRGVLAASGLDPQSGRGQWERVAHVLSEAWERRDRERVGPSFPMVPGAQSGWLSSPSFRHRLSLAVERNSRDRLRFEVHRIALNWPPECVEPFCEVLPQKLRDTDCVCRPSPSSMLLLIAGPAGAAERVGKRIATLWQESWQKHRGAQPAPPLAVERAELSEPGDADHFVATATGWLSRI